MSGAHHLVCAAGIPNYGDELIAATWLRYLAERAPDTDVVVDCLYPENAAARLTGIHPRARFTNVLWQLCLSQWGEDDPAVVCARVAEKAAGGLDGARVIHLAGGGFLNGLWPVFSGLLAGIVAGGESGGARIAATGQGLWPPVEGGGLVRSLLDRFDVVDVRDAPSASYAGVAEDAVLADDVFLGFGARLLRVGEEVPEVMVSVQSLTAEGAAGETVRWVAEVLRVWGVREVGLLECSPDIDREVLALAEESLPVVRRYSLDDVLARGLPARAGQCWISTRFHPHLVAAAAGAVGVALDVRPDYYGTKHRSLIDGGSGWRLLERGEIPERPVGGGYEAGRLRELRDAKAAVAGRIYG
ncbi:polysaccharide pyruvyl transferase family protein [Streptomyces sp. NPDC004539]|uniref:polysaccharide pyruvyl transferase family protein n=1 Tax=Streptomyces sp. NPDC004539 TaxID=3154280 RepID=UPI0033A2B651